VAIAISNALPILCKNAQLLRLFKYNYLVVHRVNFDELFFFAPLHTSPQGAGNPPAGLAPLCVLARNLTPQN